jgi:hypothetical protein
MQRFRWQSSHIQPVDFQQVKSIWVKSIYMWLAEVSHQVRNILFKPVIFLKLFESKGCQSIPYTKLHNNVLSEINLSVVQLVHCIVFLLYFHIIYLHLCDYRVIVFMTNCNNNFVSSLRYTQCLPIVEVMNTCIKHAISLCLLTFLHPVQWQLPETNVMITQFAWRSIMFQTDGRWQRKWWNFKVQETKFHYSFSLK